MQKYFVLLPLTLVHINFTSFRKNFSKNYEIFIGNSTSFEQTQFNTDEPTIIIIHGWTHGNDTPWVRELAEGLINYI